MKLRKYITYGDKMYFLQMSEILVRLSQVGIKPRSHYDAVRMFDSIMRTYGVRAKIGKVLNPPSRKARLLRTGRNDLIVQTVEIYTV